MLAAAPPKRSSERSAHFDEYQRFAVTRDEIDLAEAAAIIARNQREPRLLQKRGGKILRIPAARAHQRRLPSTTALPSMNWAAVSSRTNC